MRKEHPKNYIKELREARGLSLEKLARRVGVSNPHISMLELGKRGLSWRMAQKLAAALDCHPLEIIEGPDDQIEIKTAQEKEIIQLFRNLPEDKKQMFIHILLSFPPSQKPPLQVSLTNR
jgi:transcriptional regulator with XRE-family HTH domain